MEAGYACVLPLLLETSMDLEEMKLVVDALGPQQPFLAIPVCFLDDAGKKFKEEIEVQELHRFGVKYVQAVSRVVFLNRAATARVRQLQLDPTAMCRNFDRLIMADCVDTANILRREPSTVDTFMAKHPGSYSIRRTYSKWNSIPPPKSCALFMLGGKVGKEHFFDIRRFDVKALADVAVNQRARYRRERELGQSGQDLESYYDEQSDYGPAVGHHALYRREQALGQSGQDLESDYDEPSAPGPRRTLGPAERVCSQRGRMTRTPARVKMEPSIANVDIRKRSIPSAPGKPLAQVKIEHGTPTPMSVNDGKEPFTTAAHIDMTENSDEEGVERVWSYQKWGIITRPRESDTSILKSLGDDGEAGQMATAAKISKAACSTESFTKAADRAMAIENAKMSKAREEAGRLPRVDSSKNNADFRRETAIRLASAQAKKRASAGKGTVGTAPPAQKKAKKAAAPKKAAASRARPATAQKKQKVTAARTRAPKQPKATGRGKKSATAAK